MGLPLFNYQPVDQNVAPQPTQPETKQILVDTDTTDAPAPRLPPHGYLPTWAQIQESERVMQDWCRERGLSSDDRARLPDELVLRILRDYRRRQRDARARVVRS